MSNDKDVKQDGKTAAPATPTTEDRLGLLIELLLSSKQAELEKEAAQKHRLKALDTQREKNQSNNALNLLKLQARCSHLKGKGRRTGKHEAQQAERVADPNVSFHLFVDGTAVIKCLSCGARWKKDDTSEFLVRNGKKFPNVTKIGWPEALGLVAKSSNTQTSSEVPASQFNSRRAVEEFSVPEGFEF